MLPKNDISPPTLVWLWSRDSFKILPFAVMQRVARFVGDSFYSLKLDSSINGDEIKSLGRVKFVLRHPVV